MRISCPICDTGFNVSEKQVGQKGLCPKCSTKFIIPTDPDDDIEILAEGEIPEEPEEKREAPKSEKLSEKRKKKRDSDKEKRKSRASTRLIDEDDDDDDEFDTGGAGKIIGMLAIGLIIGLAIGFVLGRMTAGKDAGEGNDAPEKPSTEANGDTTDPFGIGNS